ncbi:MAG: hypothetical protein ABJC74_00860 [Gemmatimonadota bacterium]
MSRTPPRPPPGRPEDRRALLSAYKDVVESEKTRGKSKGGSSQAGNGRLLFLTVITIGLVVAMLNHDRWLDPVKFPPESRQIREASLRLVMSRQIHGIDAWREAHGGALPDSAAAAKTTLSPFKYEVASGRYRLTGNNGDTVLTYESSESLSTFLGQSYEIVRNRGRQ